MGQCQKCGKEKKSTKTAKDTGTGLVVRLCGDCFDEHKIGPHHVFVATGHQYLTG